MGEEAVEESKQFQTVAETVDFSLKEFLKLNDIQNKDLFVAKKKHLDSLNIESSTFFSSSIESNGILYEIHTTDEKFLQLVVNELKSVIQKPDVDSKKSKLKIYLFNQNSSGLSDKEWEDEASQDCWIFKENEKEYAVQRDFVGYMDEEQVVASLAYDICDGFYNFLRWLLPRKLIVQSQVILHSSCVLNREESGAFVFLGKSGAGKTTITSLREGRKSLGDDMNLVFSSSGNLRVSASSVGGAFRPDVSKDRSFPILGFFWLIQSEKNSLEKISKIKSYEKIILSMTGLFLEHETIEIERKVFELADLITEKLPFYNLYFKKDENFWRMLES